MRKIVINTCWGGFGLSDAAIERYQELSGSSKSSYYSIERDDPYLVQVVEELGESANGKYSQLKVVEIPDDVNWYIHDYDGVENIKSLLELIKIELR
jgi:hypothetical protein